MFLFLKSSENNGTMYMDDGAEIFSGNVTLKVLVKIHRTNAFLNNLKVLKKQNGMDSIMEELLGPILHNKINS